MPMKVCPQCGTEYGSRKLQCKCGHEFGKGKQGRVPGVLQGVRKAKHPLIGVHEESPGLWVYDLEKGMPKIPIPPVLSPGPIDNQDIYDYTTYHGVGDTMFSNIPWQKVADPELQKRWKKAQLAMREAWRYLADGPKTTKKKGRTDKTSV